MAAIKGKDYLSRLKNTPPETWLGDEKIIDPTSHPLVASPAKSIAKLYDLQWDDDKKDYMLYTDPITGELEGTQFLVPRSKEELKKRGQMHLEWAKASYGFMGRSTDFMSAQLLGWYSNAEFFGKFADNVREYFRYVQKNDLFLTHVLINPQVDRSQPPSKQPDEFTYLGVVKETEDGIIVRGAKMMATAGPYADEVLVFPFANQKMDIEDYKYAISFAVPMSAPGLRCIARESYVKESQMDYPLASQFDELDGILVFDDVFVPWNRVFIYQEPEKVNQVLNYTSLFTGHQSTIRLMTKLQFVAGLAMKATEVINTNVFPQVQDLMGEITTYIELCRAAITAAEEGAKPNEQGIYIPDFRPLSAIRNSGNRWYPRSREILQIILAGGLMYQPASFSVFDSPIKEDIEKYFRGADISAKEKIQIYKIANELAVSSFGSRHELYERYYAGDPLFLRINSQYKKYDKTECYSLVDQLINQISTDTKVLANKS
ncbi:pyoverdin chromophore biosynthetic protein PvcC [Neobacillus bataviensis LMG 21833]|uniref:Pyoverdin chromophore biosynthetic protein PvcC n=1 Tax=Neobacillus bataviensis LMG 21833 TaxID=1117379 RepID=K6D096_9BACI|nr:4-hydroxyphenylacetate 3-hydroxylase N-terminal domain-containing protein [Neobacillus bataviensis]EKN65892.1 pyoverdin chromophore biosynthetic protein PvcC [Neobacillus bataviensis LMG 21833]